VKEPDKVNMVIFRENAEDIYAGIEWPAKSPEARKVIDFLVREMKVKKIRFPESSAIGIKPVSIEGSERLIRKAYQYAIDNRRKSVTWSTRAISRSSRGRVPRLGISARAARVRGQAARRRSLAQLQESQNGQDIVIKDVITDAFLQQILLRPRNTT